MSKQKSLKSWLIDLLFIGLGSIMSAWSLNWFLIPNHIIDGGVTGISIMLSHLSTIKLSYILVVLNIPFIIIGYKNIGKRFLIKALYAMIVYSMSLYFFANIREATADILLASIFGGIILGAGSGIVMKYGGCLDGTEVVAILISKRTIFSVGRVVLFINIGIYAIASILFGLDKAMYSAITYVVSAKAIDFIIDGFDKAKACTIITEPESTLKEEIYKKLGRTATISEATGLVSGELKKKLYVVVTRLEISELKQIVEDDDSSAFGTIVSVDEVIGNHIKKIKKEVLNEISSNCSE